MQVFPEKADILPYSRTQFKVAFRPVYGNAYYAQVMRSNVQLRLARTGWSETIAVTGSSAIDTGIYTSS